MSGERSGNQGRPLEIYTVGHSTRGFDELRALLRRHQITMLVDVRARPFNSFLPWFNRDRIKMDLLEMGIVYAYLGDYLGRLPGGPAFSARQEVDFVSVEQSEPFLHGIDWLLAEAANRRLCLLCGEADPEPCHRDFLIARHLIVRGVRVLHILPNGDLQEAAPDLFHLPGGAHGYHPSG